MKLFFSAAEASSDIHAAALLKELNSLVISRGQEFSAIGIGGAHLKNAGYPLLYSMDEFLAMGGTEALSRLPKVVNALHKIEDWSIKNKPDLVLVLDYPEFHMRLGQRLKKLGIPTIYYIPPKVWVWRSHRVKFLKKNFDLILGIFPFEKGFYSENDCPFTYVGNPLLDELPLTLTQENARKQLKLDLNATVITLMPGSRPAELRQHFEVMLRSADQVSKKLNKRLNILIPLSFSTQASFSKTLPFVSEDLLVQWVEQGAGVALKASDAGIIKSGTSTLEAALLDCPHVIVYRVSFLTRWIFEKLTNYQGPVGLSNLVFDGRFKGWKKEDPRLCPEILNQQLNVENLSNELLKLLTDQKTIMAQKQGFKKIREILKAETQLSPSQMAAQSIFNFYHSKVGQT